MKLLIWILISALTITTMTVASAQSFNHDPTFSTQNYKHPNKARKVEQIQEKRSIPRFNTEYVRPADNYKATNKAFVRVPIVVLANSTWQKGELDRNYKQSFKPRCRLDRDEQIRRFLEEIRAQSKDEELKEAARDL